MRRDRIRESSIEVTVGAFMFMIVLALAFFTIVLSRQALFKTTYYRDVRFREIMGLREGDNIFLRGVAVGKIRKIRFEKTDVQVRLALDYQVELYEDYRVEILPTSLLGGRYLIIHEGSTNRTPVAADAILVGTTPVDLVDEATKTVQSLRKTLEGGVLDDLKSTVASLKEVTDRLARGEGTIGRLMKEETVYEDIRRITADLKAVTEGLRSGTSSIGKLLNDDGHLYAEIDEIAANLAKATKNLAEGRGLIGRLLSDDEAMYDDLRAAIKSFREVGEAVDRGEGTLGRLVRDDELYTEIIRLVKEGRAMVDDFRETSPITSLSSVFFGAF